jgi:hypothetical protein
MNKSKAILGTKILCEYDSSNIHKAQYDIESKLLEITFSNGSTYEYDNVDHKTFTEFDMAESQGKHFNKNINKKFTFRKK